MSEEIEFFKAEAEVVPSNKEVVNYIVEEWNKITSSLENNTILFCCMVNQVLGRYPESTAKEIIKEVSEHPGLKRSISLDRAWAGLRLVRNRPDVIEYQKADNESRTNMKKPVLKKDGDVNYEFYIELYKHKLDEGVRSVLEEQAVRENWSYRKLISEMRLAREKIELLPEDIRIEKAKLIREIAGILRSKPIELVREVRLKL